MFDFYYAGEGARNPPEPKRMALAVKTCRHLARRLAERDGTVTTLARMTQMCQATQRTLTSTLREATRRHGQSCSGAALHGWSDPN